MAKHKVVSTVRENLGSCVIHADDVAALSELLRSACPEGRFEIQVPGYTLDEPADFSTLGQEPKCLGLRVFLDGADVIALDFGDDSPGRASAPGTVIGRGVVAQAKAYLDQNCRPPLGSVKGIWFVSLGGVAQLLACVIFPIRGFASAAVVVAAGLVVMMVLVRLSSGLDDRCWIHTVERKARQPSFWKRNRDAIASSTISGVFLLLLGIALGRLLGTGTAPKSSPSVSTAPGPSPAASAASVLPPPSASVSATPPPPAASSAN